MSMSERRPLTLLLDEHNGETHAEADLIMDGGHWSARGTARCNPADRNVVKIGEQIAIARALFELAQQLLHAAASDIEAVTHEHARLHL
jgi:hypothetical protein